MEKFELVDENGNKTGKILTYTGASNINNFSNGYYLSVVGVVIINRNNEILLQKRSKLKKSNPGKWGICGRKVRLGENCYDAIIRETLEEIGNPLKKDELKIIRKALNNKIYFTVFYVKKDIDIIDCKLQKDEVEEVKYFKIEELEYLENEGFEWLDNLKKII